jgi:glycine cleavage system H protein
MLKFSEDHEWARLDGEICSVGISPHAVEQLGDIVFVELPEIGKIVDKGDAAAAIESVKAASDIYSPAAGQITEINDALLDDLTLITPEGAMGNWLFKLKITDITVLDHLMDEDVYKALVG